MVKPLYCCLFLPITLLSALCTDPSISFKFVCIGNSVKVFQNFTSSIMKGDFTLHKQSESDTKVIAVFTEQSFRIFQDRYIHKLSLENGTILLHNFEALDEATYVIIGDLWHMRKEVQLCAVVPPSDHCIPRIEFKDNHLIAFLNVNDCGRPASSAYWHGYSNKSVIMVEPGKEAGPYYACIQGPSLRCARFKATDYCSSFRIGALHEELQPMISLEKSNIQDSSITLQCQSNGKSAGMFRWRRNGFIITNNAKYSQMDKSLIIRHLNNDDKYDIYTCLESGGRFQSDLYSIESSGPSVIQVIPSITMVKEMDTLNVSCLTDCFPLCSVTWSKLDPFSGHNIVILKNDALQITNVVRKMSGNYTCKVQNLITGISIEGSLSLNIHYGPDKIVLNTSNNIIEMDEFGSITILCTAECFPPCVIHWTERNVNKQIGDAELKLINISANDNYTCHAWNPIIDTRKLSQTINIAVKYDETLIPKIGVYRHNVSDSSVELKCHSFRKPKGKFYWRINGSLVNHSDRYSPDNDLLYVRNLTAEDEKNVYTCEEPGSKLHSDPFWIKTSGPTPIRFSPKDLMVKEHNGLNVSCLADCYHLCSFHWFKLDPSSGHKHLYSKENVLHITNVRREMSGNYSCKVQNIISGAFKESSLSLDVLYGPNEILFNTSSNITEVEEFGSITIVCTAKCFPPCLISWTERYRETMMQRGSDLMLVDVKMDGIYTCLATNPQIANATIVETIIIKVKYDATLIPKIVIAKYNASDSSIVLKCLSSRTSVGRFSWSVNGSKIIDSDTYSEGSMFLLIKHLSTDEQYNSYTCTEPGSGFQSDHFPMKTFCLRLGTIGCLRGCEVDETTIRGNIGIQCFNGSLDGPDEVVVHTSENNTEVYPFSSTTVFCSADCFPPCLFRWTFSYTDTVIEGAILTLVNVTSNGSLTCHVINPINLNATLSESIYIKEKSGDVRHKTSSVDKDQDGHVTFIDIPSIRYVLYVIPVIGGIGAIIAVVTYLRKKYIPCTSIAQVSNNTMNAHYDIGESNQEETVSQHYWTIVTNVKGDLFTAVESDINMELRQVVDSPANSITIYNMPEEHEAYSYSFNSDPIEIETSCSDSTKSEGYINPIHSDPIEIETSCSDSTKSEGYINPIHSDPIEIETSCSDSTKSEGYINPIHSDHIEIETSCSDSTKSEGYINPIHSDHIEIETSCSDSTKSEGYINPIHSDPTTFNEYSDPRLSHSMECNAYIHPVSSDPLEPGAYTDSTPPDYKGCIESIDDPISSHPGEHDQYTASACLDAMERDTNIDDVETENVETDLDIIPSDLV